MEAGEGVEATVRREVQDETGLEIAEIPHVELVEIARDLVHCAS